MSLHGYFAFQVFQKEGSGTSENILELLCKYGRHRRFIFSISAIYLEAAHKQNSALSCTALASH